MSSRGLFGAVLRKEMRDTISSARFAVLFGALSLLVIVSCVTGALGYRENRARYEAAKAENIRQMEGITDWLQLEQHRIFLPPLPLSALVSGISHDLGKTMEMRGSWSGEGVGSHYEEEPILAVSRFLDLEFVFQIAVSLFAILLGFDLVSGEKERGTLRLTFANAIPRDSYLAAKWTGAFLALSLPLLLALAIGTLTLPLLGVPLSGEDFVKLCLIFVSGVLFLGVFLAIALLVSVLTRRTSSSFLVLLVVWILGVLIVPRVAVMAAGRSVAVPGLDEIGAQRAKLSRQLAAEDREKLADFTPSNPTDVESAMTEFEKLMGDLSRNRTEKMDQLTARLTEERANRQASQERLALSVARISPLTSLSLAMTALAGTSLQLKEDFVGQTRAYRNSYNRFMEEKTGFSPGAMTMRMRRIEDDGEKPQPVNVAELPEFNYTPPTVAGSIAAALPSLGLLMVMGLGCFAGAVVAFRRYDVR